MERLKSNQFISDGVECRDWIFDTFVSTFDAFDAFDDLYSHRQPITALNMFWVVETGRSKSSDV